MQLPALARSLQRRVASPSTWVAAASFGGLWVLIRCASGILITDMGIGEFLVPAALLAGHILLSPLPWQWTGDDRSLAPAWRGVLQALPWNALWLGLFVLLLQGAFRPPPAQRDSVKARNKPKGVQQSLRQIAEQEGLLLVSSPISPPQEESPRPRPRGDRPPPPEDPERPRRPGDASPQDPDRPPRRAGDAPPPRRDEDRPPRREDQPPQREQDRRPASPVSPAPSRPNPEPAPASAQINTAPAKDSQAAPPRENPAPPAPQGLLPVLPEHRSELMLLLMNFPFAMILGWFLAEKERAESTEEELQALARQARTLALQSQLHPHALYNTLSGLTELVHEDPDAAEEALIGLTALLRLLTRHAAATELPLAQERTLIRHFLAIEEIRLGPRLKVSWNWPDWADAVLAPPLLLQPLVENAVKHGIAAAPEGGVIKIGIFRADQELILRVANTGLPLAESRVEGTGLQNLRERLALLERLRPSLSLRTEEGWTLAELRLRLP